MVHADEFSAPYHIQDPRYKKYDDERIKFLSDISNCGDSLYYLQGYLEERYKKHEITYRAKKNLEIYANACFNRLTAVTFIRNTYFLDVLQDQVRIFDCDLDLGLTVFDQDENYAHCIQLIKIVFLEAIYKSLEGKERAAIGTTSSRSEVTEIVQAAKQFDKADNMFNKVAGGLGIGNR